MLAPNTMVTLSMTRKSRLQLSFVTISSSLRVSLRDDSMIAFLLLMVLSGPERLSDTPCCWFRSSNSSLDMEIIRPVENFVPNRHELTDGISWRLSASTERLNCDTNSDSKGARFPKGWASQKHFWWRLLYSISPSLSRLRPLRGNSHLSLPLVSYSALVVAACTRDRRRLFEMEDVVFVDIDVGPTSTEGTEKVSMVLGSHPLQVPVMRISKGRMLLLSLLLVFSSAPFFVIRPMETTFARVSRR
mmetsp:Transcript_21114/g.50142  ORF Transcript_21114/g.50142 Transcript_21114/m.50142 type:complete len:246 (+) Transcript_21114:1370-2107(+)